MVGRGSGYSNVLRTTSFNGLGKQCQDGLKVAYYLVLKCYWILSHGRSSRVVLVPPCCAIFAHDYMISHMTNLSIETLRYINIYYILLCAYRIRCIYSNIICNIHTLISFARHIKCAHHNITHRDSTYNGYMDVGQNQPRPKGWSTRFLGLVLIPTCRYTWPTTVIELHVYIYIHA